MIIVLRRHLLRLVFAALLFVQPGVAQIAPQIANISARHSTSLDGPWHVIIDRTMSEALDYRAHPLQTTMLFSRTISRNRNLN